MPVVVAVAVGVVAWWATELEPFSAEATVVVLGSGCVAGALGRRWERRTWRPPRAVLVAGAVIAVALATWQAVQYPQSPRSEHPTISSLLNEALDPRPLRAAAFAAWLVLAAVLARTRWFALALAGWLWFGWHVFVRAHH